MADMKEGAIVIKQEPVDADIAAMATSNSIKAPRIVHQRKMNFTPNEVSELIGLIQKYKESLFGPYPFRIKRECWYRIATELADVEGGTERSSEEVKKKWENLQHDTKSKIAMFQKCNGKVPNINWTENNDVVLEIIESRNLLSMSAPSVAQMTKISETSIKRKNSSADEQHPGTIDETTECTAEKRIRRKTSTDVSQTAVVSASSVAGVASAKTSVTLTIPTLPASMLTSAARSIAPPTGGLVSNSNNASVKYCSRAFVSGACAQTIIQSTASSDQYTAPSSSNSMEPTNYSILYSNSKPQPTRHQAAENVTNNSRKPHEEDENFVFSVANQNGGGDPMNDIASLASPFSESMSSSEKSSDDLCIVSETFCNNRENSEFIKTRNVDFKKADDRAESSTVDERRIRLEVLRLEKKAWQLKIDLLEEKLKYQRHLNEKISFTIENDS